MALFGNIATFSWEQLIDLIVANELAGTLRIEGEDERLDLFAQGGLILLPLPQHRDLGRDRKADKKRANKALVAALGWHQARFTFLPQVVPRGLTARRSVLVKPGRVLSALRTLRTRSGRLRIHQPVRFPLRGKLEGVGLAAMLWTLTQHERTGTLLVTSPSGRISLYFDRGKIFALARQTVPAWMVDSHAARERLRERALMACGWRDAQMAFLPERVDNGLERGLWRLDVDTERLVTDACRQARVRRRPRAQAVAC